MLMPDLKRSTFEKTMRILKRLGWVVLAFVAAQPFCSTARVTAQRAALLDQF